MKACLLFEDNREKPPPQQTPRKAEHHSGLFLHSIQVNRRFLLKFSDKLHVFVNMQDFLEKPHAMQRETEILPFKAANVKRLKIIPSSGN
jgi:hypothetical protein